MSEVPDLSWQQRRDMHYFFAHRFLPQIALSDPEGFTAAVGSGAYQEMFPNLWRKMSREFKLADDPPNPQFDGTVYPLGGDAYCALVRMPEPQSMTEAYFCALLMGPKRWSWRAFRRKRKVRFFTLEYTLRDLTEPSNVVCEWASGGEHLNYGFALPVDADEFVRAICELAASGRNAVAGIRLPERLDRA